ncbi:MAG TPA: flagellar cap protein FliD N-terminal domain-containing protein, partial [Bacilli bacterium]
MVNRISNIGASGLDIELTVGKLMQAHRMPLDKLMQKKQILTWQSEGYREMNSKILELRNAAFDMKLEGPYLTKKAVSADETVISATAAPEAVHGTYQLQVLQLATSASLTSTANTGASSSSATLSSIGMTTVPGQTLTIAGEKGSATINLAVGDTIAGFISAVNAKSTSTGVKASYDATLDRFFFASTTTGVNSKVELTSSEPAF